jgi:hypothetical protein
MAVKLRWSRAAVRVTSVGLLVLGAAAGVQLGRERDGLRHTTDDTLAVQADAEDMHLLKVREGRHAAARAWQREAEGEAAVKAAAGARAAAGRARVLERKVIAAKAAEKAAHDQAKAGGTVPYAGPIPTSCKQFVGNRATGCALMIGAGFPISQFPCLNKLWNRESGWNARAANAGSGAYGIPQALPGRKMSSVAADWRTNPATQITWGLGYIKGRYGSPCGAWAQSESTGSY